jgi:magnesium chelatase family protein
MTARPAEGLLVRLSGNTSLSSTALAGPRWLPGSRSAAGGHAGEGLICPAACGPEAAWASPEMEIIAAASLFQLANHVRGT